MERRQIEENCIATLLQNHFHGPENHCYQNPISENHHYQNPISEYPIYWDWDLFDDMSPTDIKFDMCSTNEFENTFDSLRISEQEQQHSPTMGIQDLILQQQRLPILGIEGQNLLDMRIQAAVGNYIRPHEIPCQKNYHGHQNDYHGHVPPRSKFGFGAETIQFTFSSSSSSNIDNWFHLLPKWQPSRQKMCDSDPIRSSSNRNGIQLNSDSQSWVRSHNELDPLHRSQQHTAYLSLTQDLKLKGKATWGCNDQCKQTFFLKKFGKEKEKPKDIENYGLISHLDKLMVDSSGIDNFEKLFEQSNEEQITDQLHAMNSDGKLLEYNQYICTSNQGSRSMQKFLELLGTPDQIALVLWALRRITLNLTKDKGGCHVIKHFLQLFSVEDNNVIRT